MPTKYFTLHQLNTSISKKFQEVGKGIWIIAEIAQVQQKNHIYLELVQKKDNTIIAKNRGVIWANTWVKIQHSLPSKGANFLTSGRQILILIDVEYHPVFGLSLKILDIDSSFTLGELERQKQETIQRLKKEGLWVKQKSLPLPTIIQKIAIISSEHASGFIDFKNQLKENNFGFKFNKKLFTASVQGKNSASEISERIQQINNSEKQYDAIIIIRGGGAKLDLESFDQFPLCQAIALSKTPIITGIGHQTDETVCDMVAHTSLKTPTAVAEFLLNKMTLFQSEIEFLIDKISLKTIQKISQQRDYIYSLYQLITTQANKSLHNENNNLNTLENQINKGALDIIQIEKKKITDEWNITSRSTQKILQTQNLELGIFSEKLKTGIKNLISQERNKLTYLEKEITLSDPEEILKKGFSITTINGQIPDKKTKITKGDLLETRLSGNQLIKSVVTQ